MIENTVNKILYVADGIQREWPVSFDFKNIEDISLYILKKNPFEEMVEITENFEWNEQKNAIIYPTIASGLPVVEKDTSILVIRNTPATQLEDSSKIPFTSEDMERALDKLTMEVQDNKEQITRSLRVPHNSVLTPNMLMKNLLEAEKKARTSATSAQESATIAENAKNDAQAASEAAQTAQKTAEQAATSAETAAQTATDSINSVDQKVTDAVNSANKAEQASADTLENATKAEASAQTAITKAEEAAQSAKDAAEAAQNLSKATETTYGISRIATSQEATTGTNNEAYITPLKAKEILNTHSTLKNNPHSVTKAQVGLGNVDNTSDANKPVSSATQEALDKKADLVNGTIPEGQVPTLPYLPTSGGTVNGDIIAKKGLGVIKILLNENNGYSQMQIISGDANWAQLILQNTQVQGQLIASDSKNGFFSITSSKNIRLSPGDGYKLFSGDNKILDTSDKAVPNGVASLGSDGKVPTEQLPLSATGGKSVGEVFFSQSKNASDNPGALPAWTGEYYSNGSSLYPDLYNWVKSHSELQTTKTEYDNAISLTGSCAKYVVDEVSGSLRLPKLTNYIKMADSVSGLTQSGASLPNITGSSGRIAFYDSSPNFEGALGIANETQEGISQFGGTNKVGKMLLDASDSNTIYGSSDTVTPAHTTLYPWVYAFNSAVKASVAQAAEFTGALSGKANTDLGNIPANIDYVVDSYSDEEGNWYRVYKSGWIRQGGHYSYSSGTTSTYNSITVTFLKEFADTNYIFTKSTGVTSINAIAAYSTACYAAGTKTTTSIKTGRENYSTGFDWIAEGKCGD